MAAPTEASLPPFFTLAKGNVIRFTALDAATGDEVTDVTVSNMSIAVNQEDNVTTPPVDLSKGLLYT
jgi:hypothetical protein